MTRRFVTTCLAAVLVAGGIGTGVGFFPHPSSPSAIAAPVPKELKRDTTAWGDEKGGLQAGIRMPHGTAVEFGKSAEVQVVVRNVTKKALDVRYDKQFDSLHCIVSGAEKDGRFELQDHAMSVAEGWHPPPAATLEPGEVLVRWTVLVRNSPAEKERPKGRTHSTVDLGPGKHLLVMPRVRGDLYLHFPYTEKNQDDFKGLNTGELEVVLLERDQVAFRAPVPKEKPSAVVWSEPVKVDWKASLAERLTGVWTPDGKSVLVPRMMPDAQKEPSNHGGIDFRDPNTGKVTKTLGWDGGAEVKGFEFLPQWLAVSLDGKTVYASGSLFARGGKQALRGLATWKDVSKGDPPEAKASSNPPDAPIALSPDGKHLAVVASGGKVEVVDTARGLLLWSNRVAGGNRADIDTLGGLSFHPVEGGLHVGTTGGGEWVCCDTKTGKVQFVISGMGMEVRASVASADGQVEAFGGKAHDGGQALVVVNGKDTLKLTDAVPEKEVINNLAFSPDGKHLAGACSDGVRVFDATNGKLVVSAKEHKETVFSVAYSPDGKKLLTVGKDAVKVWDVEALMKSK